ncbi:hypothetical protein Salat_2400800 [Sesamum alatum]|uniref:6,7-dimethyl-8-ribityllumazine synthase n=1 Tax=Sesamum alatum TaxID=300844 RepID=A0AAE1XYE0_9LAMI|nr:hypothetical protein Salat_2400800 [Sesamum alatum]
MGNSLRCCLACVLPCGALDLIRIVHLNGSVEEITGRVTAGEVLKNNPNHVLTQPCSQGMTRRILILSPESELKRGSIYFLIPASSLPAEKNNKILKKFSSCSSKKKSPPREVISSHPPEKKSPEVISSHPPEKKSPTEVISSKSSEKKSSSRRRERSRSTSTGGLWRPTLESIAED